jgi:ribosomal protein L29
MKKSDLTGLRTKTSEELAKTFSDKSKELVKVMTAITGGTEKNLKKGRNLKKDMARVATIIREKEIIASMTKSEGGKKE